MNEKEEIITEDHLFHAIAAYLHKQLQNNVFEECIISAGPEVHTLEQLLHPDVRACIKKIIPKLLVNLDEAHLIEHLV